MSCMNPIVVVAAYDFGTTYSGYAFSFYDKVMAIRYQQTWEGAPKELMSQKTATSLLLNPQGEFDKFGYEAETKYAELAAEVKHEGWRLFRQFKMLLHNNKTISPSSTVDDVNGCSMQALEVFAMSIKALKDRVVKSVLDILKEEKGVDLQRLEILHVLTVPAIWDDSSRQFMREAASKAGIDAAQLRLVLEPEAASFWGQCIAAEKLALSETGSQYMVIDLGGGTADISVHEKRLDGTLKEVHSSSGGPWGGKYVDENYIAMLRDIFGASAIDNLKSEHIAEYMYILREFEVRKRKFTPETTAGMEFCISTKLTEKYCVENVSGKYQSIVTVEKDKVLVDPSVVQSWFDGPIDHLLEHVTQLLSEPGLASVSSILLVGGFGENIYVQEKIRRCVGSRRLVVPENAGMIVLMGAVRCGHIPHYVTSKKRKYAQGHTNHALFNNLQSRSGHSTAKDAKDNS